MFNLGKFATLGRNEDDTLAHVATGEMVVRPEVLGESLTSQIKNKMKGFGLDPARYTVGSGANSINPATGQPEFFLQALAGGALLGASLLGGGSSGTNKGFRETVEKFDPKLEALQYAQPGITSPFGGVSYSDEGIQVTPSADVTATSEMFKSLAPDYLQRVQDRPEEAELRAAYNMFAPTMNRQQLQDMFSASIQPQEQMIDMQTDSALSRILGSRGISTGSASAMGAAQRQADLAKQQLRIGAFQGAQQAGYNDLNALQNMLSGAQGFRTGNLQNLYGLSQAQYAPFQQLTGLIQPSMEYGGALTQFDIDKLSARIDLANQLAGARAQPRPGFFQRSVVPAAAAFSGFGGGSIFGGGGGFGGIGGGVGNNPVF